MPQGLRIIHRVLSWSDRLLSPTLSFENVERLLTCPLKHKKGQH